MKKAKYEYRLALVRDGKPFRYYKKPNRAKAINDARANARERDEGKFVPSYDDVTWTVQRAPVGQWEEIFSTAADELGLELPDAVGTDR